MVDERDDRYEGQEESEYHFSDDNASYDVDNETTKVATAAVAKASPLANINRYKRMLIAGIVFVVLMAIVYKMLTPASSSPPNTDIAQQAAPVVAKNTIPKVATPATPPAPVAVAAQVVATAPQPVTQTPPQPQQTIAAPVQQAAAPLQVPAPVTTAQQTVNTPPMPSSQMMSPPPPPSNGTVNYAQSDSNKELLDRLAALEQQNAKLANVLQIEYAQKLADSENRSAASQAKLRELGTRVANMEATLNQITQLLQGSNKQISMSPSSASSNSVSAAPKQSYTVQAIIPGRAWLKSDSGDTVTVAEGDVLRDYGRITKIDPYDGTVNIDVGNKVISLSYGTGSDS